MGKQLSIRGLLRLTGGMLALAFLFACSPSTRKLDEAVFYEGPQFRLKLVRYFEDLPFHYTGEVFRVQCSSQQTSNSPAHKTQDAGWRSLGNGGAIGSKSAAELVERERRNFLVIDDRTLVWTGIALNVSFDACGSFQSWDPTSLPESWIVPSKKPDYCKPLGTADCRYQDFQDEGKPRFEEIRVTSQGSISFIARSKAIRNNNSVRVQSQDFGKTWQTALL
jgi:hypothetical protein